MVNGVSQGISVRVRVQITAATFVQVCIGASLQFGKTLAHAEMFKEGLGRIVKIISMAVPVEA